MVSRGAFRSGLYPADDLGRHTVTLRGGDHFLRMLWRRVDLHPVAHVVHLVHLAPTRSTVLLNQMKQRGRVEEVVLDDVQVWVGEVQHLGLSSSTAVNESMEWIPPFLEQVDHHRRIGPGGGQHELAGVHRNTVHSIRHVKGPGVHQVFRETGISTRYFRAIPGRTCHVGRWSSHCCPFRHSTGLRSSPAHRWPSPR